MKEFNENEKFEKDLNEIQTKLDTFNLSDEFKNNLQAKLNEEYNKKESKRNIFTFSPAIMRKVALAISCFVVLITGCATFADEIENLFASIFPEKTTNIEQAIENENYKKIDMDYVESNNVSIKVDYIVEAEDSYFIVFNVLTDEYFEEIVFDKIEILNEKNEIVITNFFEKNSYEYEHFTKSINDKNKFLTYKINDYNRNEDTLKIKILEIGFKNKNSNWEYVEGSWFIELDNIDG